MEQIVESKLIERLIVVRTTVESRLIERPIVLRPFVESTVIERLIVARTIFVRPIGERPRPVAAELRPSSSNRHPRK